jgi:hypothetical protein
LRGGRAASAGGLAGLCPCEGGFWRLRRAGQFVEPNLQHRDAGILDRDAFDLRGNQRFRRDQPRH